MLVCIYNPTSAMQRNGAYNCALPYGGNRKFHLLDKLEFVGLLVQNRIHKSILPNWITLIVFPEKHILLEMSLFYKAQTFQ